ncbi:IS630 family transposase [Salmonella enterica subsp. diarizonae serovar 60:r:e,n,x,z15 str. 01-0170]|nr:IS630 family transposase [Salmonella enterica subsp. diarizonae serovar 60:r:e,n,x,z15 str. 01-0170]
MQGTHNNLCENALRVVALDTLYGAEGLISLCPGRESWWSFEPICALLVQLVSRSPGDFVYQRSR